MTVKLSIGTPIVTLTPGGHGKWEDSATIEDLAKVAEAADRLGYHHLTCSEHVVLPASELARRGARYWDPLATLGYIAARTRRIRLATNVLVLAYHHPLEIAKRYGTLDVVSNGRVILGVGVGTLKEEFDLLGAPYDNRGPRADDALRALRAALSAREPSYHGEFYDFEGLVVDPSAVQEHVPIWVGGRTVRSLRRAANAGRWLVSLRRRTGSSRAVARSDRASGQLRGSPASGGPPRPDQRTEPHPGDTRRNRGSRSHHRLRRACRRDA